MRRFSLFKERILHFLGKRVDCFLRKEGKVPSAPILGGLLIGQ
jgi:hypothetical protein